MHFKSQNLKRKKNLKNCALVKCQFDKGQIEKGHYTGKFEKRTS